ncbi:hypothetical protein IC607_08650 [Cellulomonas sp. JH27-2]|uniref:hypothetical protein n=1 Tax=Cellulomonas sp. JH27-2 TaxID=2774139 RepID=UPI00177B6303|nr:hypothetical protein [Cellulomonas sp. JH27-2]MBD8059036.1 hypothetical protein [Cellulomonas sp. JH27-2]
MSAPQHRTELTRLDFELLRALVRFGYMRPDAAVGYLGASTYGVRKSWRRLHAVGAVRADPVPLDLVAADGAMRATTATAWTATSRGAGLLGPHHVPGTELRVTLGPPRPSPAMARHTVGVAHLAAWYRRSGFEVTSERDILSLERPTKIGERRVQVVTSWTVSIPGKLGVHPPDLGAVDAIGGQWAVELERKTGTVNDYADIVGAYQAAGLGQIWHVLSQKSAKRLVAAASRRGIQWGPPPARGVFASTDGLVRLQGWLPGRLLAGPETWKVERNFPTTAPAGLPLPSQPARLDTWRQGTVVDPEAGLWEPVEMWDAA